MASSVVITGQRFLTSNLLASDFEKVYLAEGDSWMDASAAAQGSLPFYLVQEFNRRGKTRLIINISTSGQTLQRIEETMQGEYLWWLSQQTFDGVLFSAGGNDFIDAARDPAPGQGLLKDMAGLPLPANGYDCVKPEAVKALKERYLDPNFEKLYQRIRHSSKNADTPLFLNCYDTPTARDAPAATGRGPWLYDAYKKNAIDESLWTDLTAGVFRDIQATIAAWSVGRTGVYAVPTAGTLTPAQPNTTGTSGDWQNEIHPSPDGWRKLAKVWADEILRWHPV